MIQLIQFMHIIVQSVILLLLFIYLLFKRWAKTPQTAWSTECVCSFFVLKHYIIIITIYFFVIVILFFFFIYIYICTVIVYWKYEYFQLGRSYNNIIPEWCSFFVIIMGWQCVHLLLTLCFNVLHKVITRENLLSFDWPSKSGLNTNKSTFLQSF